MEDAEPSSVQAYTYRAHGKLLLSGEYVVLDGSLALALPSRFGQTLNLGPGGDGTLQWEALDPQGHPWLRAELDLPGLHLQEERPAAAAQQLRELLREAGRLQPEWKQQLDNRRVVTRLEFPRHWGLGSSSTLVSLVAQWSGADPFDLQEAVWPGGSGYDLACAQAPGPIFYRRSGDLPTWEPIHFHLPFTDRLFFIHQGAKQDTRRAIASYRQRREEERRRIADEISAISEALRRSQSLSTFEQLLQEHERLISHLLKQPPLQAELFSDYKGVVKSLGAWGGDFMLVTGEASYVNEYFRQRGFTEIIAYPDMVRAPQTMRYTEAS